MILTWALDYQVAQLRVVFKIREKDMATLFPSTSKQPDYLAYVEWFTPFKQMDPNTRLYQVSRSVRQGRRLASVIDVEKISRSCHLFLTLGLQFLVNGKAVTSLTARLRFWSIRLLIGILI